MAEEESLKRFVGIDWGSAEHQVCIVEADRPPQQRKFEHSGRGIAQLVEWVVGDVAVERIGVAIEVPRGAIVESLLERGVAVFALNPKQLDRFRDRHSVAGAKDDRRDAYVLAESLRTDRRLFRVLKVEPADQIRLRELVRVRASLAEQQRRLQNQLRDLLQRYHPALLTLSPAADDEWVWALIEKAPTPVEGARLRRPTIDSLLREYRIRRITAAEVRDVLQREALTLAPGATGAHADHAKRLVPVLKVIAMQERDAKRELDRLVEELVSAEPAPEDDEGQKREHSDFKIAKSLAGSGTTLIATVFAEAHPALAARDYTALRACAGSAPVLLQSGKSRRVVMRHACNGRLRNALYLWASVAAQREANFRAHYQRLRAAGKNHPRAIRGVVDRLLRILCGMLRTNTLYDPIRFADAAA